MSQYTHVRQGSTAKLNIDEEESLESLQNIPSHLDLTLNGDPTQAFLTQPPRKEPGNSLLDPETFRRLSTSTISSIGGARSTSPYPHADLAKPQTWRDSLRSFWLNNQGLFLVTFSQLFGALMNVATRLLELEGDGMDPLQILFARQGITATLCSTWMWWAQVPDFPLGAKGVRGLLVIRSITGFFGIFGMYYSLQYLSVADAVVINFLAPSVASYGCYLFLREPFPRSAQFASLISLLGVVLIARPISFFSSHDAIPSVIPSNSTAPSSTYTSFPRPTSVQRLSAVCWAMVGVLGAAGAFTSIRWIGDQAHPLLSVNYFSVYCTLISFFGLILAKPLHLSSTLTFAFPANPRQWGMLTFLGICGFVMQFLLTKGLAIGGRRNGARSTNMIYTNMLYALALDKIVFNQSPGWWSLSGSGLILGSAIFVALQKQGVSEGGIRDDPVGGRGGLDEEEMMMLNGEGWEEEGGENEDAR